SWTDGAACEGGGTETNRRWRLSADAGGPEQLRDVRRRVGDGDPRGLEGRTLRLCRSSPAGDDRAGVAHSPSGWGGAPRDEGRHRLAHLTLHEGGGALLLLATDLADHHHGLGLGILVEHVEHVDESGAHDRIATDAHARRLTDVRISHRLH